MKQKPSRTIKIPLPTPEPSLSDAEAVLKAFERHYLTASQKRPKTSQRPPSRNYEPAPKSQPN